MILGNFMRLLLILILSISTNLFASELDAQTLLNSIDRSQLSLEQQELYDRAVQQKNTEVIELTESDLVEAEKQIEKNVLYKLKVKHIKKWLRTADHSTTCLDEYLQQRKKQMKGIRLTKVAAGSVDSSCYCFNVPLPGNRG